MSTAGWIIEGVLFAFIAFLWVRFIIDWVQIFARSWEPRGAALIFLEFCYTVTDPPILGLRKVIKPVRIGNFALDLSFEQACLGTTATVPVASPVSSVAFTEAVPGFTGLKVFDGRRWPANEPVTAALIEREAMTPRVSRKPITSDSSHLSASYVPWS